MHGQQNIKKKVPTHFTSNRGKNLALSLSAGSEFVSGLHVRSEAPVIRRYVFQSGHSK